MVLGIASQDSVESVRQYIEQLGVTFPILLDHTGSVHAQYQQHAARHEAK